MSSNQRLAVLAILCLALGVSAFAGTKGELPSKALERADVQFDRDQFATQMGKLNDRLQADRVLIASVTTIRAEVSDEEIAEIDRPNHRERKMKVGVVRDVFVPMSFSNRGQKNTEALADFGAIRYGADGEYVWSGSVLSEGATAIRVHLTDFELPDGAELYVYNDYGMAFGPYTARGPNGDGDFWTNTIVGSDVTLQLYGVADVEASFTVAGVGHMTEKFALARSLSPHPNPKVEQANCSFNADCVVGASCTGNNSAVNAAADAVAHMLFRSGGFYYICSGGLIADSDASSSIPYFITANHCISRGREASSLETFFFYTSSCGSCPSPGNPSTNGASITATNRTSDYTLLQLSGSAPAGAAFLGWSSDPIANSNGANLYRLSHPQGAPQSYSEHVVDTSKGTCSSWPRGSWIYSRDTLGATEGGSSGSPVVNSAGQLVGQLSGACGFNVNDTCDTVSNATVDGAFAAYFSEVESFLGGGGTPPGCTDADGDGWCVEEGDCNDNDPTINPGARDRGGKKWADGIDNDCNGIIDG